jgi:hypothetical protein
MIQWEITCPGLMFSSKMRIRKGMIIVLTTNSGITPGTYFRMMKAMPEKKYSTDTIFVFMTWLISMDDD